MGREGEGREKRNIFKGQRTQPERTPNGQSWDNLSNRITALDYKTKNKISNQDSVLTKIITA